MIFIKKFDLNNKNFSLSLYLIFVLCVAIAFEKIIGNIDIVFKSFHNVFSASKTVLSAFIYGFFIAYILNSSVKFIENNLFGKINYFKNKNSHKRAISVFFTFLIYISTVVWIIAYLVPEINESVKIILNSLPNNITYLEEQYSIYFKESSSIQEFLVNINEMFSTNYTLSDILNIVFEPIKASLAAIPTMFSSIVSTLLNIVLGIVIAFYALCDKEIFQNATKKILYTIFKRHTVEKIIYTASEANTVFEKFFIGKAIDSTIIGIIFFFGGLFLNLPYLLLLSLIIGITNMIPYFGPFIGAVPVVIIVFLSNLVQSREPMQFIWVTLFIFVLQQFDGIILGPKILGESTGLRPMGVIFAIIVGGATFGVLGMFLGVPAFAVVITLFNSIINKKYDQKYTDVPQKE